MKIYVFNLARRKVVKIIVAMLLAVTIVLSATIGIATKIYGRSLLTAQADALPYEKIVILDAGHGGEDSGALSASGPKNKSQSQAAGIPAAPKG